MTDMWHVGIVHQPRSAVMVPDTLRRAEITWLPDPGSFRFIADPFCVWQDNTLTVFVEAYDYRVKRGEIHYYTYDRGRELTGQGVALREPFHLSYPSILRDGGQTYMLPEASKSGQLTLYVAERFPDRWRPLITLLDRPAIDASVIQYQGLWWMFYALPGADHKAKRELHVAYAEHLTGPWKPHAGNPVCRGLDSARPGGTPFVHDGALYLPVQDCIGGYGMGINLMRIDRLTPDHFESRLTTHLSPDGLHAAFPDGLHTLAGDGDVSVIDVKRDERSPMRHIIKFEHGLRRLLKAA